jgi:hypothetical protein
MRNAIKNKNKAGKKSPLCCNAPDLSNKQHNKQSQNAKSHKCTKSRNANANANANTQNNKQLPRAAGRGLRC